VLFGQVQLFGDIAKKSFPQLFIGFFQNLYCFYFSDTHKSKQLFIQNYDIRPVKAIFLLFWFLILEQLDGNFFNPCVNAP